MRHWLAFAAVFASLGMAQAAEPAWNTYTDPVRHFTISYPPGWTVDAKFIDRGYRFFQGDTDDFRDGVAFKPTYDLAPGTNLESNQLALVVQTARPADRCVASSFLVDPAPDFTTDRPLEKPEVVRTVALPGDLYVVEHIALIVSQTPCVAVHYYVNYGRPQRGDPRKPFDRQALFNLLGSISATLKLAK